MSRRVGAEAGAGSGSSLSADGWVTVRGVGAGMGTGSGSRLSAGGWGIGTAVLLMNLPEAFLGGMLLPRSDIQTVAYDNQRAEASRRPRARASRRGARGISDSASLGQPIVAREGALVSS